MKIACQEGLVPGRSFKEKVDNLVELGFEGVELNASFSPDGSEDLARRMDEIRRGLEGTGIGVSSICGGYPMAFLASDLNQRKAAVEGCKKVLKVAGQLGASGPILVPIFGGPQLTDPWPLKTVTELEKEVLAAICRELAPVAAESKTNVILEPLNRYETHLLRKLADAVEICNMAGNPAGLRIMADFFHMNIEELDIAKSIRKAGKAICHVHLADSTRLEPGSAHTDFAAGFKALKAVGYKGYMAFECGLSGADPKATLRKSVKFLKDIRASLK